MDPSLDVLVSLYQEEMTAARGYCERRVHYVPALFIFFAGATAATAALVACDTFKESMLTKAALLFVGGVMYAFVFEVSTLTTRMMAGIRKLVKRHYRVALQYALAIREMATAPLPDVLEYPRSHLALGTPYEYRRGYNRLYADVCQASHPDYVEAVETDPKRLASAYWNEQNCPDTHVYETASTIRHLALVAFVSLWLLAAYCIADEVAASWSVTSPWAARAAFGLVVLLVTSFWYTVKFHTRRHRRRAARLSQKMGLVAAGAAALLVVAGMAIALNRLVPPGNGNANHCQVVRIAIAAFPCICAALLVVPGYRRRARHEYVCAVIAYDYYLRWRTGDPLNDISHEPQA